MSASATVPEGYKQTEIGVFPKDWEIKKFGDIFDFKSTASNSRSDLTETDEAHYIHYGDIHTIFHRHLDISKKSTPRIDLSLCKNATRIRNGDWVMADASEDFSGICKAIEISGIDEDKSVVAGLHTFLLRDRNEEYSPGFKGHLGEAKFLHDQYVRVSVGLKVFGVTKTSLRDLLIPVPPKTQQTKIEEILTEADAQIQSFEHLIAKKRDIKQGAMQELLTGKTRLSGFNGEWEVKQLNHLCSDIKRGASPRPITNPKWFDNNSQIGWVRISDATSAKRYLLETKQKLSGEGVQRSRYIPKGNLIMSICATVGRPIQTQIDVCIHDGFVIFENIFIDQNFLYYVLCDLEPRWSDKGQTGSQMNLNTELIKSTEISLPSDLLEQEAIAAVLSDMDAEIAALEERLEKAKAIKQGMMQQLLTGKIRLVD